MNENNENKITLTSAQITQGTAGKYELKVGGPRKGKNASDYNTVMGFESEVFEFDVVIEFEGTPLTTVFHHAGVDLKTNVMNNIRPKKEDSDDVKAAKLATLRKWHADGKVVVKAKDKARNLYVVDEATVLQSAINKDAKAVYEAAREALLSAGIDPDTMQPIAK